MFDDHYTTHRYPSYTDPSSNQNRSHSSPRRWWQGTAQNRTAPQVLKDEKHPSGPSSAAAVSFLEVSEWAEPEAPAAAAAAPEQPESLLTMLGNEVKVLLPMLTCRAGQQQPHHMPTNTP